MGTVEESVPDGGKILSRVPIGKNCMLMGGDKPIDEGDKVNSHVLANDPIGRVSNRDGAKGVRTTNVLGLRNEREVSIREVGRAVV